MVSKFSICSQKATPELLKAKKACVTWYQLQGPSHFTPDFSDWGIPILKCQHQREKTCNAKIH